MAVEDEHAHGLAEGRIRGAGALELVEARRPGDEERAVPELARGVALRCGSDDRAEERNALPIRTGHGDDRGAHILADEAGEDGVDPQAPLDVLVVDDNSVNLMVAKLQLQKLWPQARIATASSAAQALQLLDTQGFDVALVDMVMPEMDGMQLTQQIRQRFPAITARMPIIALTANTNPVERERCLAAGMDDVLHKPLDESQLIAKISSVLSAHAARGYA